MLLWFQLFLVVAGTAALLYVSRGPLSQPGSHGFFRFFAWECMLVLIVVNLPVWHVDPLSATQLSSCVLLALSVWLPIHAVRLLKAHGKPSEARNDDPALYGFEKTSALVTTGSRYPSGRPKMTQKHRWWKTLTRTRSYRTPSGRPG